MRASAIVFDLDDTLYPERDYVRSGFAAVGRHLREAHGLKGFHEAAWALFEDGRRGDIFDAALAALGQQPEAALVAGLVARYRRHRPRIALAPDAARWLAANRGRLPLALITDGPTASQSRKVTALALRAHGFGPILLTDRWGIGFRKPHERAFRAVERALRLEGPRLLYVADNAAKDFAAPRRLGWQTVQIRREGGLHRAPPADPAHAAERVIESLDELEGE